MSTLIPSSTIARTDGTISTDGQPSPAQDLLRWLLDSSLVLTEDWESLPAQSRDKLTTSHDFGEVLPSLVQHNLLTDYQAARIQAGKTFGLVLGNYRVLDRIGAGGMGVVFKAEHLRMRRIVAVKVLPLYSDPDDRRRRRFLAEMRAVAQLQHPHIVAAMDDGKTPGAGPDDPPLHYFVMEYVPGQDLEAAVLANGCLAPEEASGLVYQVASALAEAHKHNLVHRDIKPSNIRVTPDGQAKLLDFGLVCHGNYRMTAPGTVLGTLDYLAAEQARDASAVDIRADIYALGGTLFWCLTGRTPFPAESNPCQNLLRRLTQQPPSLRQWKRELPAALDALVSRMMALDPDDRHPTPQAVMNALLPFLKTAAQEHFVSSSPNSSAAVAPSAILAERGKESRRVLVVDDSRTMRMLCVCALEEGGIACEEAADGGQALAALRAKAYDLVLTDWMMPGMTGLELCQELRANPPCANLKIILFSASVTDDEVAKALAAGVDDYLGKQFTPVQLTARVKAALRLKESQDRADRLNGQLLACNRQLEENLLASNSDLVEVRNALVLGLADLVAHRDVETFAHVLRMQNYCRCLAKEAALHPSFAGQIDENFMQMLGCCAPLHDIGKAGLPDHILAKAGHLDGEERLMMQTHTTIGAETLQKVGECRGGAVAFLQMAIDVARHHHERYDGKGYPDRLAGNAIPLAARVVAVADAYDALRQRQAYKPALPHGAAVEVILQGSSGQFDPGLLLAFQGCAAQCEQIFREIPG